MTLIDDRHRVAALTLASMGGCTTELGSWLPPMLWKRLEADGLIEVRSVHGFTTQHTTAQGLNWLKRVLA